MHKKLDKYNCVVRTEGGRLYRCAISADGIDMQYGQLNWQEVKEVDQPFLDAVNKALGTTLTVSDFGKKTKRPKSESLTVLVVDDDDTFRGAVCSSLVSNGFKTITAKNGKEALERLAECKGAVQLILLDLSMPVMTGWEFLKYRQDHQTLKSIPVIVQTGEIDPTGLESATAVLPKPYNSERLLNMISEKIKKSA